MWIVIQGGSLGVLNLSDTRFSDVSLLALSSSSETRVILHLKLVC